MDLNEMNGNWQDEAPTLASMEKANPFTVPESYFAEMEEHLRRRVGITAFDNSENLFTVPAGYFEELEDNITSAVKLESIKNDHGAIFTLPERYFDSLEERIKSRIQPEITESEKPRIRGIFSTWPAYAAAACITAIISFGLYFNLRSNNNTIETEIAALPTDEIIDYLQLYSDAGDAAVILENIEDESALSQISSDISEQEIEQYLKLNL
ncbi:hypothetical protein ACFSJU_01670 [Paradesertivirga mongoliensis]|uniref:Uncharacterized protein n=1 Tax=Paradesertivirga mongoliensis TaxID=2100740 RepID=A0ABW4ZGD6_9SPHI|nr:hypothetical protein [Pedobacter mongoliensis]